MPFDVVTLSEQLDKEGHLNQVGGLAYLGELAKNTPSVANIKAYAAIIREIRDKGDESRFRKVDRGSFELNR